jgi:hypothetical protein
MLRINTVTPLVFFFFITITGFSQNVITDSSATVVSYWKKGDKKTFLLEKTTEQGEENGIKKEAASFLLTVQVLNETDSSYTLDWRYAVQSIPKLAANDIPGITAFCNNLHIIYTTDETGSFEEVKNITEIQAFIKKAFDLVVKPGLLSVEATGVMKELQITLSSRAGIENVLLKDIQLFHTLYGLEYSKQKEISETELPNVLGGEPFPAVIGSQLTSIATDRSYFSVETTLEIDKKATTKIVIDFLNAAGKKMGKKEIKESEFPEISINDVNRFIVDKETGWMKKIHSERLSDMLGSYRKEITVFTLN